MPESTVMKSWGPNFNNQTFKSACFWWQPGIWLQDELETLVEEVDTGDGSGTKVFIECLKLTSDNFVSHNALNIN